MFDLALWDSQVIMLPGTCTNTTPLANELTVFLTAKKEIIK